MEVGLDNESHKDTQKANVINEEHSCKEGLPNCVAV